MEYLRGKRNLIKFAKPGRVQPTNLALTPSVFINETGKRSGQSRITTDPNFHLGDAFKHNPAVLSKSSMNRLRLIIYLGMMTGALPWKWNTAKYQILRWEGGFLKFWWIQWSLVTLQTICIGCFQLWGFREVYKREGTSYREMFLSSINIYWYLFAILYRLIVYLKQEEMRSYINSMLRLNQQFVEKYLIHLEGYEQGGKMIMNVSIPMTCCQVGTSLAFFIVFSDQPHWYLISYIPYKSWYLLIPGALQDVIVVGSDITIYMLMAWIIAAHAITVDFWMREAHNSNETGFTSEVLRRPRRAIGVHRTLSVLNAWFNDCMADLPIPILKLTIFFGLVIGGYVMVRSMNHLFIDDFPSSLIYPFGILNCGATGFGFISMSARMNNLGRSFVDSWNRTRDKHFRRILMSCMTIRVWVGQLYFVTMDTVITFLRTVVDQIINCIVTFP